MSLVTLESGGGRGVKLVSCGARGPEFEHGSRHFDFRDLVSPVSMSCDYWNIVKATKILKTTQQIDTSSSFKYWIKVQRNIVSDIFLEFVCQFSRVIRCCNNKPGMTLTKDHPVGIIQFIQAPLSRSDFSSTNNKRNTLQEGCTLKLCHVCYYIMCTLIWEIRNSAS